MSLPEIHSSIIHYNEIPKFCLGKSILDVGSSNGEGAINSRHGKHFRSNDYLGIDIQKFEHSSLPVIGRDIFDFFPDRQFDTILLLHVLEHIPIVLWVKLFKHLYSMLNNDGYIVVNVPFLQVANHCRDKHMVHEVLDIDESVLYRFCLFQKFILSGRRRISSRFKDSNENILFAILRFVVRIAVNHKYSIIRTIKQNPFPKSHHSRIIGIYQKEGSEEP